MELDLTWRVDDPLRGATGDSCRLGCPCRTAGNEHLRSLFTGSSVARYEAAPSEPANRREPCQGFDSSRSPHSSLRADAPLSRRSILGESHRNRNRCRRTESCPPIPVPGTRDPDVRLAPITARAIEESAAGHHRARAALGGMRSGSVVLSHGQQLPVAVLRIRPRPPPPLERSPHPSARSERVSARRGRRPR